MDRRTPKPKAPLMMDAITSYDLTRAEIEEILKTHLNYTDAVISWDVSNRGQVRGASIKVRRVEIQG